MKLTKPQHLMLDRIFNEGLISWLSTTASETRILNKLLGYGLVDYDEIIREYKPRYPDGWHIFKAVKPIPDRRYDYYFWHDHYDGVDDGNRLCGAASSIEDAIQQIKEIEEERNETP